MNFFQKDAIDMQEDRFELFDVSVSLICKSIQKIKSEKMSAYGLKSSHVMFLIQLDKREDGLTAAELSKVGHVDKAQISRVISELTQKGFVTKLSAKHGQKYNVKLTLTATGKKVAGEINEIIAKLLEYVSSSIPRSDLDIFYRTLFTISDNLFALTSVTEV
jgi:DNA-binding MarR family transcriptional regulator